MAGVPSLHANSSFTHPVCGTKDTLSSTPRLARQSRSDQSLAIPSEPEPTSLTAERGHGRISAPISQAVTFLQHQAHGGDHNSCQGRGGRPYPQACPRIERGPQPRNDISKFLLNPARRYRLDCMARRRAIYRTAAQWTGTSRIAATVAERSSCPLARSRRLGQPAWSGRPRRPRRLCTNPGDLQFCGDILQRRLSNAARAARQGVVPTVCCKRSMRRAPHKEHDPDPQLMSRRLRNES